VVGVVKDFHFHSLKHPIGPLILQMIDSPNSFNQLSMRVDRHDLPETIAFVKATFAEFAPSVPFNSTFIDDLFFQNYTAEKQLGRIFVYFAGIAILIACLGLFGLAAFNTEQRRREIGMRKVVGATVIGVVGLLSKEFVVLVSAANLVAWPIAYFVMNGWLQDFAYRVEMSWWLFPAAGALTVFITITTVAVQTVRAALENPIQSLRYE
jgi:putative ABC transport system permease protein